jgi:hypothetical protein
MAAPKGNQYAVKAKRWTHAIDKALAKRSKARGIEALDELAEKLLTKCDEMDLSALKELGDRLEGRPAQSVTISGDEDNPLQTVNRNIVSPEHTDG